MNFFDRRLADLMSVLKLKNNYTIIFYDFQIYIDGPFGAPASNIFRAEHAVLVNIFFTSVDTFL
jgi:hypothetical protein